MGDLPSEANSLQFFDANTGVVVCSSSSPLGGRIMRTSDGGATWTAATCQSIWLPPGPCQNNFTALHFPTRSFGCAVGGWVGPLAYTTESGGATWTEQKTNIDFGVADSVFFLDTNKGWATVQQSIPATSALLLTADGGRNWSKVESGLNIRDLAFMSADQGLVAASVGVQRSADGGLTWSPPEPFAAGSEIELISEISFVNAREGWAVGSRSPAGGRIVHTADGGQTWQTQFETDRTLNAVYFVNTQRGWAVGSDGVILATSNGGSTWSYQSAATSYGLHEVYFVDENYGWIAGDYWNPISYMHWRSWRTSDGGAHWTPTGSFPVSSDSGEYAIQFVSRTLGYVASESASSPGSVWRDANDFQQNTTPLR